MPFFEDDKPKISFDDLQTIDINAKTFHLSGKFKINNKTVNKKEFSELINELGGSCRGFGLNAKLIIGKTDYYIVADDGIKDHGVSKEYGRNATTIQKHNMIKGSRYIPIIKEKDLIRLIEQQKPRRKP